MTLHNRCRGVVNEPLKTLHFLDAMQSQRDLGPDLSALFPYLGRAFLELGGPVTDERQRLVAGELHVAVQAHAHQELVDFRVCLHEKVAADVNAGLERLVAGQPAHGRDVHARPFQLGQLLFDRIQHLEGLGQVLLEYVVDERLEFDYLLCRRFLGHVIESGSVLKACQKETKRAFSFCFDNA